MNWIYKVWLAHVDHVWNGFGPVLISTSTVLNHSITLLFGKANVVRITIVTPHKNSFLSLFLTYITLKSSAQIQSWWRQPVHEHVCLCVCECSYVPGHVWVYLRTEATAPTMLPSNIHLQAAWNEPKFPTEREAAIRGPVTDDLSCFI